MVAATPATLPEPPYYVAVFTSRRPDDADGYAEAATRMVKLAAEQPGFLAYETARTPGGLGISVAYFADAESLATWGRDAEHREVQRYGREHWYESYALHIAKVERAYRFDR